jgi:hypothetical protein
MCGRGKKDISMAEDRDTQHVEERSEHDSDAMLVDRLLSSRKPIPKNGHLSQLEAALEWRKNLSPEEREKEIALLRRIARLEGPPGP